MKIVYEIPKRVRFDEIDIGESFAAINGTAYLKVEKCYRETNLNDLRNAIELESGELKYFYPASTVIPLEVVLTVRQEAITC